MLDWRTEPGVTDAPSHEAVAGLLATAGLDGDFRLHRLKGRANNRVFRAEVGGSAVLLKAYFQHPDDLRDRLGAEFSFSRFAWDSGVRCLPQPLACDPRNGLGVYEFVEGRPLQADDVTADTVRQALDFYHAVNRRPERPESGVLPNASEACFSIAEHLACVERRLWRLRAIPCSLAVDREAAEFVEGELGAAWREAAEAVRSGAAELGLPLEASLPAAERRLSPSDFGFHNAILAADGRLRFIDFEYAGWDDPAKMVCDFFCQPAVPVPLHHYSEFIESAVGGLPEPDCHRQRCTLLLPVYGVKWCCILLNEFVPSGGERRRFADEAGDPGKRKAAQLRKARLALRRAGAVRGAAGAP